MLANDSLSVVEQQQQHAAPSNRLSHAVVATVSKSSGSSRSATTESDDDEQNESTDFKRDVRSNGGHDSNDRRRRTENQVTDDCVVSGGRGEDTTGRTPSSARTGLLSLPLQHLSPLTTPGRYEDEDEEEEEEGMRGQPQQQGGGGGPSTFSDMLFRTASATLSTTRFRLSRLRNRRRRKDGRSSKNDHDDEDDDDDSGYSHNNNSSTLRDHAGGGGGVTGAHRRRGGGGGGSAGIENEMLLRTMRLEVRKLTKRSPWTLRFLSPSVEREYIFYVVMSNPTVPVVFGFAMLVMTMSMQLLFTTNSSISGTSVAFIGSAWICWIVALLSYAGLRVLRGKLDTMVFASLDGEEDRGGGGGPSSVSSSLSATPRSGGDRRRQQHTTTTTTTTPSLKITFRDREDNHQYIRNRLAHGAFSDSSLRRSVCLNAAWREWVSIPLFIGSTIYLLWQLWTKTTCSGLTSQNKYIVCTSAIQFEGSVVILVPFSFFFMPMRIILYIPLSVAALVLFFVARLAPGMPDIDMPYVASSLVVVLVVALIGVVSITALESLRRNDFVLIVEQHLNAMRMVMLKEREEEFSRHETMLSAMPPELLLAAQSRDWWFSSSASYMSPPGGVSSSGAMVCTIRLNGFDAWTSQRSPLDALVLIQRLRACVDDVRQRYQRKWFEWECVNEKKNVNNNNSNNAAAVAAGSGGSGSVGGSTTVEINEMLSRFDSQSILPGSGSATRGAMDEALVSPLRHDDNNEEEQQQQQSALSLVQMITGMVLGDSIMILGGMPRTSWLDEVLVQEHRDVLLVNANNAKQTKSSKQHLVKIKHIDKSSNRNTTISDSSLQTAVAQQPAFPTAAAAAAAAVAAAGGSGYDDGDNEAVVSIDNLRSIIAHALNGMRSSSSVSEESGVMGTMSSADHQQREQQQREPMEGFETTAAIPRITDGGSGLQQKQQQHQQPQVSVSTIDAISMKVFYLLFASQVAAEVEAKVLVPQREGSWFVTNPMLLPDVLTEYKMPEKGGNRHNRKKQNNFQSSPFVQMQHQASSPSLTSIRSNPTADSQQPQPPQKSDTPPPQQHQPSSSSALVFSSSNNNNSSSGATQVTVCVALACGGVNAVLSRCAGNVYFLGTAIEDCNHALGCLRLEQRQQHQQQPSASYRRSSPPPQDGGSFRNISPRNNASTRIGCTSGMLNDLRPLLTDICGDTTSSSPLANTGDGDYFGTGTTSTPVLLPKLFSLGKFCSSSKASGSVATAAAAANANRSLSSANDFTNNLSSPMEIVMTAAQQQQQHQHQQVATHQTNINPFIPPPPPPPPQQQQQQHQASSSLAGGFGSGSTGSSSTYFCRQLRGAHSDHPPPRLLRDVFLFEVPSRVKWEGNVVEIFSTSSVVQQHHPQQPQASASSGGDIGEAPLAVVSGNNDSLMLHSLRQLPSSNRSHLNISNRSVVDKKTGGGGGVECGLVISDVSPRGREDTPGGGGGGGGSPPARHNRTGTTPVDGNLYNNSGSSVLLSSFGIMNHRKRRNSNSIALKAQELILPAAAAQSTDSRSMTQTNNHNYASSPSQVTYRSGGGGGETTWGDNDDSNNVEAAAADDDDEDAMRRSAAKVDQTVSYFLFASFAHKALEREYQLVAFERFRWRPAAWSSTSNLLFIVALIVVSSGIYSVNDVMCVVGCPLPFFLAALFVACTWVPVSVLMGSVFRIHTVEWWMHAPWLMYVFITIVGIFVAPVGNVLGNGRVVWLYSLSCLSFLRPRWAKPHVMWLTGEFPISLAFLIESQLHPISPLLGHRASNAYAALLNIIYTFIIRHLWDGADRDVFSVSRQLLLLQEEITVDQKKLVALVAKLAPQGVASELFERLATVDAARMTSAAALLRRQGVGEGRRYSAQQPKTWTMQAPPSQAIGEPVHPYRSTCLNTTVEDVEFCHVLIRWKPTSDMEWGLLPPPPLSSRGGGGGDRGEGGSFCSAMFTPTQQQMVAMMDDNPQRTARHAFCRLFENFIHDHVLEQPSVKSIADVISFDGEMMTIAMRRIKRADHRNRSEERAAALLDRLVPLLHCALHRTFFGGDGDFFLSSNSAHRSASLVSKFRHSIERFVILASSSPCVGALIDSRSDAHHHNSNNNQQASSPSVSRGVSTMSFEFAGHIVATARRVMDEVAPSRDAYGTPLPCVVTTATAGGSSSLPAGGGGGGGGVVVLATTRMLRHALCGLTHSSQLGPWTTTDLRRGGGGGGTCRRLSIDVDRIVESVASLHECELVPPATAAAAATARCRAIIPLTPFRYSSPSEFLAATATKGGPQQSDGGGNSSNNMSRSQDVMMIAADQTMEGAATRSQQTVPHQRTLLPRGEGSSFSQSLLGGGGGPQGVLVCPELVVGMPMTCKFQKSRALRLHHLTISIL